MSDDENRPGALAIVLELNRIAERIAQLAAEVSRMTVEDVERRDHLHNEIERAHRRWWHGLIGLRWEVTGWSWDWRKESL